MRSMPRALLVLLAAGATPAFAAPPAAPSVEHVEYQGGEALRISNGTVELVVPTGYGPRVMRYAPVGSGDSGNAFGTVSGVTARTPLGDWYIRGGHRLWHAPEAMPRSYVPDNDPVEARVDGGTVRIVEAVEKPTGIQKEIDLTLDRAGSHVVVVHRLTNRGLFALPMACWAMSVMAPGGLAILPQEPYRTHDEALGPVRPLVLWAYTDLTDPRLALGRRFITLRHDPGRRAPEKIGVLDRQGWAAYYRDGILFVVRFTPDVTATYPDFDADVESYTSDAFLELETLGPQVEVAPGTSISHTEEWWLFTGVDVGSGEDGLARAMAPILAKLGVASP